MQTHIDTSWPRIAIVLLVILLPALVFVPLAASKDSGPAIVAAGLSYVSMLVFMTLGLMRLRRANEHDPIATTDIAAILKHLLGPVIPAVIWLAVTLLLPFVVLAVWYLRRAA